MIDSVAVLVSAVVVMGDETYLYWGILSNYYFNKKGELDQIELTLAYRRFFSKDREIGAEESQPPHEDPRFYSIKGDYLLISYNDIKTLNIEYLELN